MQRHLRLRGRAEFDRLRAQGQVRRHPLVILSVLPNASDHNRYGFVTGKLLGNAVIRNRIRRQMREAVRATHPRLRPGYDLVFIARRSAVGQPYSALYQAIEHCLRQAGVCCLPDGVSPS